MKNILYNLKKELSYNIENQSIIQLTQEEIERLFICETYIYDEKINHWLNSIQFYAINHNIVNSQYINSPLIVYGYRILKDPGLIPFKDIDKILNNYEILFQVVTTNRKYKYEINYYDLLFRNII